MPWTAADASAHTHGLTAHQAQVWSRVANAALRACRADGRSQQECEGAAIRQANAVAQRAPRKAIKAETVRKDGKLTILAIPFGGPLDFGDGQGRDADGEYFSEKTDLALDWFPNERPLLWHHGLDADPGITAVGRVDVTTAEKSAEGWWVQAQLDRSHRYFADLLKLLDQDALYASSGAMPHLVKRANDGELLRWPWVELSLTPAPSNLFATVTAGEAKAHYKSAGLDLDAWDEALDGLKSVWSAAFINDLPDSAFAVIEGGGSKDEDGKTVPRSLRHFPHHGPGGGVDLPHLRNALARLDGAGISDDLKGKARRHLEAHASSEGVGDRGKASDDDDDDDDDDETMKTVPETYSETLERLTDELPEFVALTRHLGENRVKVGRAISRGRRDRLGALLAAMREGASELEALLKETEPEPKQEPEQKTAAASGLAELFRQFQEFDAFYEARLSGS